MPKQEKPTQDPKESGFDKADRRLLRILLTIVIGLWLLSFLLLFIDSNERGTFGDMFGVVNALFSGLAFVGLIMALNMQRKELSYQRKQLEVQREELRQNTLELRRSAEAQENSEEALQEQSRMMALSARISAHSSILDSYASELTSPDYSARLAARKKAEKYRPILENLIRQIQTETTD